MPPRLWQTDTFLIKMGRTLKLQYIFPPFFCSLKISWIFTMYYNHMCPLYSPSAFPAHPKIPPFSHQVQLAMPVDHVWLYTWPWVTCQWFLLKERWLSLQQELFVVNSYRIGKGLGPSSHSVLEVLISFKPCVKSCAASCRCCEHMYETAVPSMARG